MHKLSVSIVLYKTLPTQLDRCLMSLKECSVDLKIFLIDNSPTDELRYFKDKIPGTEYINLKENPGFGVAHNRAILKSQALGFDYHLVLNADVYFFGDVLTPMLDYLESNNNVGHMMPLVRNIDGSIQHLCKLVPSPFDLMARRLPFIKKFNNKFFELHISSYDKISFIPYL